MYTNKLSEETKDNLIAIIFFRCIRVNAISINAYASS